MILIGETNHGLRLRDMRHQKESMVVDEVCELEAIRLGEDISFTANERHRAFLLDDDEE